MTQFPLGNIRECRWPIRLTDPNTVEFLELCDSMRELGQLVPVVLSETGELVDGDRRRLAAQRLGWTHLDVSERRIPGKDVLAAQIRLNPDLTVGEFRRAVSRLIDQKQLDKLVDVGYALGRNVDWVAEKLGLATLSPVVRKAVDQGLVHVKVAELLAKLPKGKQRELLTDSIKIPVSELVPRLQDEVRHRREAKHDRRATKRGRRGEPWLRAERVVLNEVNNPTEAMRLIRLNNAETAFDGWNLALRWALRLDLDSLDSEKRH
jgi:ParB-like chromosome segregation protein Spo0J